MQIPTLREKVIGFLFSRKGRISAYAFLAFILTIFLFQTYGKACREHGYDFTSYLLSSEAMVEGTNPYQTGSIFPFVYPLFLCILLYPLTSIPYWMSNLLWFILNGVSLYYSALVFYRLCAVSVPVKDITALFLFPFLILINVIQNNFLNGQVNFIVLLLCVLFLKYYLGYRKFVASVLLSAAIAIKITPLILIAYLVLRRDYLWIVVIAMLSFLFIVGLPYAVSGPVTVEWYSHYLTSFLNVKFLAGGQSSEGFAFSITSIMGYLLPTAPRVLPLILAALLSLTPIFWCQLALRKNESADRQPGVFALYMTAVLFISPVSETHHLIHLLPAVVLLTLALLFQSRRHRYAGLLVLTICLASFLTAGFYYPAPVAAVASLYGFVLWIVFNPMNRQVPWPVVPGAMRKVSKV